MLDRHLQQALAFYQSPPQSWYDDVADKTKAAAIWIWGSLQGDFNQQQTTGQIVTGTAISMIPLVDQICDVRDLIANCKKIKEDDSDSWAWLSLGLTLVGCFPVLGSLTKGSLKVMFLALRKSHFKELNKTGNYSRFLEGAVAQLNRYLDMPAVRKALRLYKIYNPYNYLAGKLDNVKGLLTHSYLLGVMDKLMQFTRKLFDIVTDWGPASLKRPVAEMWDTLVAVRNKANSMLANVLKPLTDLLDRLANRLRIEGDNAFRVHVGDNVHLYGGARASEEINFIKREKPDWVDVGGDKRNFPELEKFKNKEAIAHGWPDIEDIPGRNTPTNGAFKTFDHSLKAIELPPGTVLYRVVDPSSSDNSICWIRKEEFDKLTSKSSWRRRFAVWKKWNENGEYVTYTVPPGNPLKVWEGRAATQVNEDAKQYLLEGGGMQIVVDPSQLKKEYTSQRYKTGWGYSDADNDPVYPFTGLPQLETINNWYQPKEKK